MISCRRTIRSSTAASGFVGDRVGGRGGDSDYCRLKGSSKGRCHHPDQAGGRAAAGLGRSTHWRTRHTRIWPCAGHARRAHRSWPAPLGIAQRCRWWAHSSWTALPTTRTPVRTAGRTGCLALSRRSGALDGQLVLRRFVGLNSRLASRYSVGRVFLVGDVAHVHSPDEGQPVESRLRRRHGGQASR